MQIRCNENVAVLIVLSLHNNKVKLKSFLLEDVPPSEPLPGAFRTITDGDAFLRCCKWKKNDLFGDIFQKYIDIKGLFGIDVVLFDGYAVSNKDCAHKKRTEKKLNIVIFLMVIPAQQNKNFSLLTTITKRSLFQSWLGC